MTMVKHTEEFRLQAVKKAISQGIRPIVRELKVSRSTLKRWLRSCRKGGLESLLGYHRHHRRSALGLEKFVVSMKERNPRLTLEGLQRIVKTKKSRLLTLKSIHCILERYAMTSSSFLPFRAQNSVEIKKGVKMVHFLLEQKRIAKAGRILNSLPALSDFAVLKKFPSRLLSLRRKAEQLDSLWDDIPTKEICKRAKERRRVCEKKKLFFTAIFLTAIEMNALHFLGQPTRIFFLYGKYRKYLHGLPTPLKYRFLLQVIIAGLYVPKKHLENTLRDFPYRLEQYCTRLPAGEHRIYWYDAIGAYFQIIGEINKSLKWMRKLLEELPPENKQGYLPEYLSLLATKGAYTEIPEFDKSLKEISPYLFLRTSLAQANALLGLGKPKEALEIALNVFYKAEKEHLLPTMSGFTFFISCAYCALKETSRSAKYLEMSLCYSKDIERYKTLFSLVLGLALPAFRSHDAMIILVNRYLIACRTLRKTDYYKTYRYAEKRGLLGFLHRIILLRPNAVINLLRKGSVTHLPKEFLDLPVFKEAQRIFRLLLLKEKESIFYGDRKIDISSRAKDFHLLVYLLLNRKKNLDRENIFDIFYRTTKNPSKTLSKAFSRIRRILNLLKGVLLSKKEGVLLNIEAKIDLEEFEEMYKLGRVLEKVGETDRALQEYQQCFTAYKKSPFEKMGYRYNFAEDRRTTARNMCQELCGFLLAHAIEKGDTRMTDRIKMKIKRENLGRLLS